MLPSISSYVATLPKDIPATRKPMIDDLAQYIVQKINSGQTARLNFICTHNSRRSHLSQIWAATAAHLHGIGKHIETYSGGTEATAFNPRAVAAIERAGFLVNNPGGENPRYEVKFDENTPALICFSKTYDDPFNPSTGFAAIMTCSDADENCPFIPGAELRSPIRYEDPKVGDGTPEEAAKYDERSRQIAMEMLYLMETVKNHL